MAECKLMKCTCKSEFQDALYGKNMRVWNPTDKGSSQGKGHRCTVCGAVEGTARVKGKK